MANATTRKRGMAEAYPRFAPLGSSQQFAADVPRVTPFDGCRRYSDPMGSASSPGVDDTAARLLITPIVGIAVPNLAGLIDHGSHTPLALAASYAWFILIAYITWETNLRLYLGFQDRTAWLTRPWHRVRLLIGLICLFTIPFTSSTLWLWAYLSGDPNATWRSIAMAVITVVAAVVFITHIYETLFLVREWESDRARGERLQRLNVEAELLALRSEVHPHTLFNNLNALSHLVEQRHPRASAFVAALAGSYRYLLRTGSKRLVPLADELALLDQFLSLVTIRYAEGLTVQVHVDAQSAKRWQIPPVVLPELLENAVKHNEFSADNPLQIELRLEGDRLTIAHDRRPRRTMVASTGVGLENLAQRFRLTTGVAARWGETGGRFVVTLPLVAIDGANIAK
jgi:two-component sensor histidine kinase